MTTAYTFEQLKEDVRKEAEALRAHATEEERGRLDFNRLLPSHQNGCIYGQMTGCCFSKRAALLIHACCVRYFKHNVVPPVFENQANMERIQRHVNGATVTDFVKQRSESSPESHFSAIEAYILLSEARNANLIAYLRCETETLEL